MEVSLSDLIKAKSDSLSSLGIKAAVQALDGYDLTTVDNVKEYVEIKKDAQTLLANLEEATRTLRETISRKDSEIQRVSEMISSVMRCITAKEPPKDWLKVVSWADEVDEAEKKNPTRPLVLPKAAQRFSMWDNSGTTLAAVPVSNPTEARNHPGQLCRTVTGVYSFVLNNHVICSYPASMVPKNNRKCQVHHEWERFAKDSPKELRENNFFIPCTTDRINLFTGIHDERLGGVGHPAKVYSADNIDVSLASSSDNELRLLNEIYGSLFLNKLVIMEEMARRRLKLTYQ